MISHSYIGHIYIYIYSDSFSRIYFVSKLQGDFRAVRVSLSEKSE